jgi:hypothetical protein
MHYSPDDWLEAAFEERFEEPDDLDEFDSHPDLLDEMEDGDD